ncbi:MAG: hypothetical protein LBC99_02145 [Spirochaetota bacterium]|jgi:hypothetical protein|nr:hypothetical protein [Spirochaetota bacterium]
MAFCRPASNLSLSLRKIRPAALCLLICLALLPSASGAAETNAVIAAFRAMQMIAPRGLIAIVYDVQNQKIIASASDTAARADLFSPGSLMKVPSLLYLLAAGKLSAEYTYHCTGRYYPRGESTLRDELIHEDVREPLAGQWYTCSAAKGHGTVGAAEALAHSCNHYFMSLHALLESAADLRSFAEFCKSYGLAQISRRLLEIANVGALSTRDRLHLSLGLPLRASVYEMTLFFAHLLRDDIAYPVGAAEARRIVLDGMRLAGSIGTARALGFQGKRTLLAKTGSGLLLNSIFKTNGWCVTAWPAHRPRILLVSFVREGYGAGVPLVCSRYFWKILFSISACGVPHSSD